MAGSSPAMTEDHDLLTQILQTANCVAPTQAQFPASSAANQPDGQIDSVFRKLRQALEAKIFRFIRRANRWQILPVSPDERGGAHVTNARWDAVDAGGGE